MKKILLSTTALYCGMVLLTHQVAQAGWYDQLDQTPDGMDRIALSAGLTTSVEALLPERSAVNSQFLNSEYKPNIRLNEESQLGVTFVDEGAGYRNSLGYFTFQDDTFAGLNFGQIDTDGSGRISTSELGAISGVETGLVFPNASKVGAGGYLQAGDTVVLGGGSTLVDSEDATQYAMTGGTVFGAGTNVGFFVGANAWNGRNVSGWDGSWGDPNVYYSVDFLNPENYASATYESATTATRHTAMMFVGGGQDDVLIGFEDLNRNSGDNDFNDAVFFVRSEPRTAMSNSNIYQAPAPEVLAAPALTPGSGLSAFLGVGALVGYGFFRRKPQET